MKLDGEGSFYIYLAGIFRCCFIIVLLLTKVSRSGIRKREVGMTQRKGMSPKDKLESSSQTHQQYYLEFF